jgi:molybdenum cofactor cytidylyltransferase
MDNVEGVILAAGFSSRIGAFKMGLPIDGKPLIDHTIDRMSVFCGRVIVVGGRRAGRIRQITKERANVQVVFNAGYADGMFSSVKVGAAHVVAPWFFLTPGDFPLVKTSTYRMLLEARQAAAGEKIFIPVHGDRKGHPILLSRCLVKELLEEPGDSNLRVFIERNGFARVKVDDPGILMDVDTAADYELVKTLRKNLS